MGFVPWLSYNGDEIASASRTLTYMRLGLGGHNGGEWNIPATGANRGNPAELDCHCQEVDLGSYIDPATDLAPWYTTAVAASAKFLGFYPTDITEAQPVARASSGKGARGAALGTLGFGGKIVQVTGLLVGNGPAALEYGRRWLLQALRGDCTDGGCDLGTLCVLPACPDGVAYEPSPFRTLYRVGLISWTDPAPEGAMPYDAMRRVTFQLQSEMPWLYADPSPRAIATPLTTGGVYASAATDDWPGDGTLRITVRAGGPRALRAVKVRATPIDPVDTICGGAGAPFQGAVAYWRAEQATSSAMRDLTGHGHDMIPVVRDGVITGVAAPTTVRRFVYAGTKFTYLWNSDGVNRQYLSAPDSVALSITGDLTVEADIEPDDWLAASTNANDNALTLNAKWGLAGQRSWLFEYEKNTKTLRLHHTANGTTDLDTGVAWQPPPNGTRCRLRCELDVDNGAAGHTKTFYVSYDGGTTFLLIGAIITGGTTSIFDSTAEVTVGQTTATDGYFRGKVYGAKVWQNRVSVGGATIRADMAVNSATAPYATFSDGVNTWTFVRNNGPGAPVIDRTVWWIQGSSSLVAEESKALSMFGNQSFTAAVAVRTYTNVRFRYLGTRDAVNAPTTARGWAVHGNLTPTGSILQNASGGVISDVSAAAALTVGVVHTIIFVRDVVADTLEVFVDNASNGTTSDTSSGAFNATPTALEAAAGAAANPVDSGYEWFGGAVFGRALGSTERAQLHADLIAGTYRLPAQPTPCFELTIDELLPGHTLTVDGVTRTIAVTQEASGIVVSPVGVYTATPDLGTWPDLEPCTTVCVNVDAGAVDIDASPSAVVSVDYFAREL